MAGQRGRGGLAAEDVARIARLLGSTDVSIPEIALRVGVSASAVRKVNRRLRVRIYRGRRTSWEVRKDYDAVTVDQKTVAKARSIQAPVYPYRDVFSE